MNQEVFDFLYNIYRKDTTFSTSSQTREDAVLIDISNNFSSFQVQTLHKSTEEVWIVVYTHNGLI